MSTIFITIRELYLHPRNVIDAFLSHQKGKYTHPFKLLAVISLITAAMLLIAGAIVLDLPDISTTVGENENITEIQMWAESVSRSLMTTFLPVSTFFLLIPSLAVSGLIFFRSELDGFYENLILSTYTVAASNLFALLWLPILLINSELILNSSARASIAVTIQALPILWIYQKYFKNRLPISIIRQLSTAASGFVLFIILSGFISGILGYMIFAILRIAELSGQG